MRVAVEPKSVISQADSEKKNREEKIDLTWRQEAHLGLLISADRHMLFFHCTKGQHNETR